MVIYASLHFGNHQGLYMILGKEPTSKMSFTKTMNENGPNIP